MASRQSQLSRLLYNITFKINHYDPEKFRQKLHWNIIFANLISHQEKILFRTDLKGFCVQSTCE